jgi:hypothetical protein
MVVLIHQFIVTITMPVHKMDAIAIQDVLILQYLATITINALMIGAAQ